MVYDVTSEARRFAMLRRITSGRNELILVQNFFDELRQPVGN